nr:hypothetical protein [Tanacetum cinerariifolium]
GFVLSLTVTSQDDSFLIENPNGVNRSNEAHQIEAAENPNSSRVGSFSDTGTMKQQNELVLLGIEGLVYYCQVLLTTAKYLIEDEDFVKRLWSTYTYECDHGGELGNTNLLNVTPPDLGGSEILNIRGRYFIDQ